MKKELYRQKFKVEKNGFYFDEESGISVAIYKFDNDNVRKLYCVNIRIGFGDDEKEKEFGFYVEGHSHVGKFWNNRNYRLYWLAADIESTSVEFEIIQKVKQGF